MAIPRALRPLLLVLPVTLAACTSSGSSTSSTPPASPAPERTAAVSAVPSASAVPSPQEIGSVLALDDFAALALLSLGVVPELAFDAFQYGTTAAILADQGVPTQPYGAELNVEAIVAADPDRIVGISMPTTVEAEPQLTPIAPLTVLDYRADWQTQIRTLGEALGIEERAEALIARVEDEVAATREELTRTELDGLTVSVITNNLGFFSPPASTALGSLLTDVGLDRPDAQKAETSPDNPFVEFSEERLAEHDADHIMLLAGPNYPTDPLTSSPLWPSLKAVEQGAVSEVSAEIWLNASAFGTIWVLEDLGRILVDGDEAQPEDDAAASFRQFAEGG